MDALFASGRVVDLILLMVAAEVLAVVGWHRWTGRGGLALGELICLLLPGVFLLAALRGALVGAWWGWIAAWLLAALAAHLGDLARRWGR
jgi:hypothetical protein